MSRVLDAQKSVPRYIHVLIKVGKYVRRIPFTVVIYKLINWRSSWCKAP